MGCDIHILTEKRHKKREKDEVVPPWTNTDRFRYNSYKQEDPNDDSEEVLEIVPVYRERDYNLFTRLAGVRSYDSDMPVFAQPRGIPDDISAISKAQVDRWGCDGHSHSYATYAELEDYWQSYAFDSHQLRLFVDALKDRMKDELWLFNKEPSEDDKENFRVIFFFDN